MNKKEFQDSIEILQNILNGMDAYIYVSDTETDEILFINEKMKAHFNLSDDVIGQTCWKVLQEGFTERCDFCPNKQLKNNPDDVVVWEEHNTVTKRYYHNVDRFIDWTGGKVHLQHSTDITELKLVEENLKKRLEQQELMVEISQAFMSDGDIGVQITNALKMAGEFMGISRAMLIKLERGFFTNIYEWDNPDDNVSSVLKTALFIDDELAQMILPFKNKTADHFDFGNPEKAENRNKLINIYGLDLKNLLIFPMYVKDKLWGLLWFDQCTEFRRWSKNDVNLGHMLSGVLSGAISRSEAEVQLKRLSSIVKYAPQYISFVNESGEFEYTNPTTIASMGYSENELYANGFHLIFQKEDLEHIYSAIFPEVRENKKTEFEMPIVKKDGSKRLWAFSAFSVDDDSKGFGVIASDITEVRELEEDLIFAKEQAEKSSQAKGEFLSNMSHEMRTPLNAVIGMTDIARKTNDYKKKDYCLNKIADASAHLLGVINDILDMSKIEANKLEISYTNFNLNRMIENIINVISFKVDDKAQDLYVQIDPGLPEFVYGDEQHITQVITNLLSNAVKFTPKNGVIEFSIDITGKKDNKISILVKVKDNGIGISAEQKSRLFKSFVQADGGISRKFGGTGLGLAISKSIIELMGGNISVESNPGSGSIFSFTLNLKVVDSQNTVCEFDKDYDDITGLFKGKKILLAEDIAINQEIVVALLEETGVFIAIAANGKEAIDKFSMNYDNYNLILMDIQMPEMDGLEASRAIRNMDNPKAKSIPIVAMTANAFKEDVEKCKDAGMNDHIRKPIDFDVLIKTLMKYM